MTRIAIGEIEAIRATDPDAIVRAAGDRRRRPVIVGDGRLMLVAADHPARGATAAAATRRQ